VTRQKHDNVSENHSGCRKIAGRSGLTEAMRRESEEQYRNILENIEDSYYEVDLEGNFTFFNNSLCKLGGCSREELLGMNHRQFLDEETAKEVFQMFHKVFSTGESSKAFDWQMIRKDGAKRHVEASASLKKDSSGNPAGFRGIIRDITGRKQIERELQNKEQKFRALADQSSDIIILLDRELMITYKNQALEKTLGYKTEDLLSGSVFDYIHPDDLKLVTDIFDERFHDPNAPVSNIEIRLRHKDGNWRTFEAIGSNLVRDNTVEAAIINLRDITRRKKAEEALMQSESQYRLLADHMKDYVWLMDINLKVKYVSPSAAKLLGYEQDEFTNLPFYKFLTAASFKAAMDFYAIEMPRALAAPSSYSLTRLLELECRRKDGSTLWIEDSFSFIRDEEGKPLYILGEGRDITERKLAEQALKKSEERYRSVFENAGLPMVIMEDSFLIFMVNDRFVEKLGYGKDEIEGKMKFTDFIASGDRNALMECFSRRLGDKPVEYECKIVHRHGERFDVLIRLGQIPGAGQFIASFTDITSRKQAELALLESQEQLQQENIRLRSSIRERYRFCDIIGKSQGMQEVYEFILQAAATQAHVIIYGESGTGKELVAKAIHETGDRGKKSFVTVHCGAIPETLMESEFFGYKKGAFTGASMDKPGYLDEADGGTLFLDEVGEIGLTMQVKLLRAIAGGGYTPVGSSARKNADVRIIAATNRNLRELVRQGIMREDFFYRIHILPIYLPPLRERKEDMQLLIEHFLQLYDKNHPPLPGHVTEALLNYDWPGNIRELQNVLHRYLTLKRLDFAGGPAISPARLQEEPPAAGESIRTVLLSRVVPAAGRQLSRRSVDHNDTTEAMLNLKALEKDHIIKALTEHNWHRGRTASALGINRKTLFMKMQKLGLNHS
jgi:PAS domain S-box-containing protein